MSPFGLFIRSDDWWEEVFTSIYYSLDGSEIKIVINVEPNWKDAILIVGGPVSG